MFSGESAVDPYLGFDVSEYRLKSVICVRYDSVPVIVEGPESFHVPFEAEIGTSELRSHVRRRLHPPVLHSFVKDALIFDVPFLEGPHETLLVHPGHAADEGEERPRSLDVGIPGEIMPYRHHLVELAVLDWIGFQGVGKAAQAVYNHPVYPETMFPEPAYPFHIACYRLVPDILAPQDFVPVGILYHHQTEVPAPVGRIHLNDNLLVLGNFLNVPHPLQVSFYRPDRHAILVGKLSACLLAFNVVRDDLGLVAP